MATVTQYLYPEDRTGAAATNKILNEGHTLNPPTEPLDFHFLIPNATPFFRDTMVVTNVATGLPLVRGSDWFPGHKFVAASFELQNVKGGVYASILLANRNLAGQLKLSYQTLGGAWTLDENTILAILSNRATDPRMTSYDEVSGKPTVFPPTDHNHDAADLIGMGELVDATYDVAAALRERTADWLQNPPMLMAQFYNKDAVDAANLNAIQQALIQAAVPFTALPFPTVLRTGNVLAITPASGSLGGTVAVPAGTGISLGKVITAGQTGLMTYAATPAWTSPVMQPNSTYYLRAMFNSVGVLTLYTQRGTDADPIPASLQGIPDAPSGGGFDSTVVDVLLAKIVTGATGSTPTVTALANNARLNATLAQTGLAQSVDVNFVATYTATFTYNWARVPAVVPIYAVVQQTGNAKVNGGANTYRTVATSRYSLTVSIGTDFDVAPATPSGRVELTLSA